VIGPNSWLLIALLVTASAALVAGVVRLRLLPVRLLCGAAAIMVAMTGGIATVNYYYGYYATWGALWADLQGSTGGLGTISAASTTALGSGHLGWTSLPGRLSGYDRRGLIYLPPQYGQAAYSRVRFPVVELFHGSPGSPLAWDTVLHISQVVDSLMSRRLIGPMVLVMPAIDGSGNQYQDCVNGPSSRDETYINTDVRADLLARYRVSLDPYEWGLTGYSSGGYCAANLALRHRSSYGAAAIINGYFLAADGPAGTALAGNQSLESANSPLYEAEGLTADSGPLPAFWVAAGTHDAPDYRSATMFTAALDRLEQVPFARLMAGDTANAWSAALPPALIWLWQQLAPPDLRVLFPVRAASQSADSTLPVKPVPGHHPRRGRGVLAAPRKRTLPGV
jgi:hypothetical protein